MFKNITMDFKTQTLSKIYIFTCEMRIYIFYHLQEQNPS